jgi:hypothetical protein
VGNPNVGEAKTIMLGIANPKKDAQHPNDDGLGRSVESSTTRRTAVRQIIS